MDICIDAGLFFEHNSPLLFSEFQEQLKLEQEKLVLAEMQMKKEKMQKKKEEERLQREVNAIPYIHML